MLTQVQRQAIARNLHVDRRVIVKALLKVDLETEKVDVTPLAFSTSKMRRIGIV